MMLIPESVSTALLDAGVTVHPRGPEAVELRTTDGSTTSTVFAVERRPTVLSPSHLRTGTRHAATGGGRLIVARSASDTTLQAARDAGVSVLVTGTPTGGTVTGHIVFPERTVVIAPAADDGLLVAASHRPGRRPWGTFAVARQLLAGVVDTQTGLAARVGITQGRVSQALSAFTELGLARRHPGGAGWAPSDWDELADWWLANYPGPGGITTYWYGLSSAPDQAGTAVRFLRDAQLPVAVSGDVAADLVAPWRRPARAVVYVDVTTASAASDLTGAGLTTSGPVEATLELIVPADPSVWLTARSPGATLDLPLADGIQVLWDLRRSPGTDTDQAVAALRAALRNAALTWVSG